MTRMAHANTAAFRQAEHECCARWAADTQDRSVRSAFMAMAKEWSRLGLQETTAA